MINIKKIIPYLYNTFALHQTVQSIESEEIRP